MKYIGRMFENDKGEQWEIIEVTDHVEDFGTIYEVRRTDDGKRSHVTEEALRAWAYCDRIRWV